MSDAGADAELQRGGELEQASSKDEADRVTPLFVLLALVLSVWVGYWFLVNRFIAEDQRGLFGDMFGGINALFSALAFAGLIYTVLLQRKELRLQREELIATRKEMEVQNSVLRLQSFENTFFEMMRRHEDIVNAIEVESRYADEQVVRGRRAFKMFFKELQSDYGTTPRRLDAMERIQRAYSEFFATRQSDVGHYFRNLYHMVKLVAEMDTLVPWRAHIEGSDTNVLRNRRYSALIRAQLSSFEHLLLFYNGLSPYGIEKFKPLIERFALLENMPIERLISPHDHAGFYERSAYGDMHIPWDKDDE